MSLSLLGFFVFTIITIRIGLLFSIPINKFTLLASLCLFSVSLLLIFKKAAVFPILTFISVIFLLGTVTLFMGRTYDTSWDGQGYHQSAVIALSQGWNPIYQPKINFEQELPSQIFAESYPSALWEVQSAIYSITGIVNSAKVMNFAISIVSFCVVFLLLRRISIGRLTSIIITLLVVYQPLYLIQFLSFMQDGFGYQLIVIAAASLIYFIVEHKSYWAVTLFILTEIILISTKYSHLPLAVIFGIIFIPIVINRFLNKEYILDQNFVRFVLSILVISSIFAYIPYGRNLIFHHTPFYPTNIPELSGSVTYNNLPHNLEGKSKITQLIYGLFSASQSFESSDTRSVENVATLKIPFTFTEKELVDASKLYNNRAGAAGPFFSGIVLLTLIFTIFMSFKAETTTQRYVFYGIYFCTGFIVVTSLMVPTPNLIRYTSQTQLLPFVLLIPILAIFKKKYVKAISSFIILLLIANTAIYGAFVIKKTINEENNINAQFDHMRASGVTYKMRAQQFYSNYVLMNEQNIPIVMVENLSCTDTQKLYSSSTTTEYCKN